MLATPLCFFSKLNKFGVFKPYQEISYSQNCHKRFRCHNNHGGDDLCNVKKTHIALNSFDSLPIKEFSLHSPANIEESRERVIILPESASIEKIKSTTQITTILLMSILAIIIMLTFGLLLIWSFKCFIVLSTYSSMLNSNLSKDKDKNCGVIVADYNMQVAQIIKDINKVLFIGWWSQKINDKNTTNKNNSYEYGQ